MEPIILLDLALASLSSDAVQPGVLPAWTEKKPGFIMSIPRMRRVIRGELVTCGAGGSLDGANNV